MRYEEIINKIREKDEKVTHCFFFWTGPTIKHIEELRRTDPAKASRLPRPVCDTCRPGLLRVLHNLYGSGGFDYTEKVTEFYYHLIKDDKLASISDPDRLMGWIVTTAFNFFRKEKIKNNELLENPSADSLIAKGYDMEEDDMRSKTRDFVTEVLAAMPNRTYARLLDEAALEIAQYSGQEKSLKTWELAERFGIPIEHFYVKISLAKKQFKVTAEKLIGAKL
ncbi:MAG: hypothetical protein J6N54_10965 [Bacteroidales bacterium]|nr:hypothetical protein [Bacteroidales bacterium]